MRFTKKRIFILISIFLFILSYTINNTNVSGHAPTNLTLEYSYTDQELTALIAHSVSDRFNHYIFDIKIWNNDVSVKNVTYTEQTTNSIFSYTYDISAEIDDILKVRIECNLGGSTTRQITVIDNSITSSVPTAHVCIALIGLSSIALLKFRRRLKSE